MGITFAIYTYGHGKSMFAILNGIKMISDSGFISSLIGLLVLSVASIYAMKGIMSASSGGHITYLGKTLIMVLVVGGLIVPKADILVIDKATGHKQKVDNLPYAFVLPVGLLEAIGQALTVTFEQGFSVVDSALYSKYGMIFGHRLLAESKNIKIANPEFVYNMHQFIERCIKLEAMIGGRFTITDLKNSDDLYSLVTKEAGDMRMIDFIDGKKSNRVTCRGAKDEFERYFKLESKFLDYKYANMIFGRAGNKSASGKLNNLFQKNLKNSYHATLGTSKSAAAIMKQNMMINAIRGYIQSDLYGVTRADQMQKSNWSIMSELAKTQLPALLNLMKGIIYACFIFVMPMMIISGGISKFYMSYMQVVLSLQLWPSINSVLNLFIESYSNIKNVTFGGTALTLGNYDHIHQGAETLVLFAGALQLSVPFICFAIVSGGASSFIHLANSMQGATSGAASMASGEVTSGNRSFDNVNTGNVSKHNESGFKTDYNQSYMQRAIQTQLSDGSVYKQFDDGSSAINSGGGVNTSTGLTGHYLEDSVSNAKQEAYSKSLNSVEATDAAYQTSRSSMHEKSCDFISSAAEKQMAGESTNIDTTTDEGKGTQEVVNNTIANLKSHGGDFKKSASASISAYAETNAFDFKVPFAGTGAKAGAKISGSFDGSYNTNNSSSEDKRLAEEKSYNKTYNMLAKASESDSYSNSSEANKALSEGMRANNSEMNSLNENLTARKEEAEAYRNDIQHSNNTGASSRKDMTHELETNLMKQYGISRNEAHRWIENGDSRYKQTWKDMQNTAINNELQNIRQQGSNIHSNADNNIQNLKDDNSHKVHADFSNVKNHAYSKGVNQDEINAKIDHKKNANIKKKQNMDNNANNSIYSTKKELGKNKADLVGNHTKTQQAVDKHINNAKNQK